MTIMKRKIILLALCLMGTLMAEAQIIGADTETGNPTKTSKPHVPINFKKATGLQLRIQAGYPILGALSVGYQLNPYFMFGGGVGYGFKKYSYSSFQRAYQTPSYSTTNAKSSSEKKTVLGALPIFFEAEARTKAWEGFSFFVNAKVGFNIGFGNKKDKITHITDDYYGDPVYRNEKYDYSVLLWAITGGWSFKDFNWAVGWSSLGVITLVSYDISLTKSSSTKKKK